ncbi:hypothetical protein BX667DRAFT_513429 [Coemansia mojavensis]|nr:hypothetical protein BX667DRAFT_513429 [Coemansia mojavensis]KAJ1742131.1 hypothetical protein LPJ68_002173 [Coemansia sp. RSA 1086]
MQERPAGAPTVIEPPAAVQRLSSLNSPGSPGPANSTSPRTSKRQRAESASPEPVPLPRLKTAEDYRTLEPEEIRNLPMSYFCRDTRHGIPTKEFIDRENEGLRKLHEAQRPRASREQSAEPEKGAPAPEQSETPAREEPPQANRMAAQVRIVDGKVVIDSDSLVISRSDVAEGTNEPLELVDESERPRFINSMTYVKQRTSRKRWSPEEVEQFYAALRKYGSDFEMVASAMPGRNRYDIRNKFKKEERLNPRRITDALLARPSSSN